MFQYENRKLILFLVSDVISSLLVSDYAELESGAYGSLEMRGVGLLSGLLSFNLGIQDSISS